MKTGDGVGRGHGTVVDAYAIHLEAPSTESQDLVLKQDDTFLVLDRDGDILPSGRGEAGLYHEGTRHLSRLVLAIGAARRRPQRLSAAVGPGNVGIVVHLTNVDIDDDAGVPHGVLHLVREIVLWAGAAHERLRVRNYGSQMARTTLHLEFGADFADIFEVRGTERARRGDDLPPSLEQRAVVLGYRGLDGGVRRTRVTITPAPAALTASAASLDIALPPGGECAFDVTIACEGERGRQQPMVTFADALTASSDRLAERRRTACQIETSSQPFNAWIERSVVDLGMMMTDTIHGPYPYAGVPWFSTPFGRDGLITAFECLWTMPSLAAAVLRYLAATQASSVEPERDAQPGKILHESRTGEMAATGEIPFGRYYGSHDATPLFVMLAAAYHQRTGDRDLIRDIWPNIEAALRWISEYGDVDGDLFVEYEKQSADGLVQQGWKDSHDSVYHADGSAAVGPIALCEIQGYVYAAWIGASQLALVLDRTTMAADLAARAERLRDRFEDAFWCPEIGTYALALDGRKAPCRIVSSNAGHVLLTGLAGETRARRVAASLLAPESFSGWGIRTVATTSPRYNPMSYHNGSVWPHDNALIARGLARYGARDAVLAVLEGLYSASDAMTLHRLPELFCGFPRRPGEDPVPYPVACNPQAWASAAVFLLLGSALGLEISEPDRTIRFTRARLPAFLDDVMISNLRVGDATIDLALQRHRDDVGINVLRREGAVHVVAIK